jgi:hypothetical protein
MLDNDESENLRNVGEALVEHASHSELSGRGMVTELFPYIYIAARRLSTRAISVYLREQHQVKLSAASIAKALREPEKHFHALGEKFEPSARIVAAAHDLNPIDMLSLEPDAFPAITRDKPVLRVFGDDEPSETFDEYEDAKSLLEHEWFSLDPAVRSMVLGAMRDVDRDGGDEGQAEPEDEKNDR